MRSNLRRALRALSAAALCALSPASHAADAPWPSRPIEAVIGYAPGGGVDLVMRIVGPALSARLGQPIVVVNKPGASAILAAQFVAQATPDGHTLFGTDGGALALNGALYSKLPYDPARDLAPVSMLIRSPLILVAHPGFAANDLRGLIELARRDGKLSYASPGLGSFQQLGMELLKFRAQFPAEAIAYKGQGPAIQDVISGQIPLIVIGAAGLNQVTGGKLKALASLTQARLPAIPNVRTAAEQGVTDAEVYAWIGVAAPRAVPRPIVARLADEMKRVVAQPEIAGRLQEQGYDPYPLGPDEFTAYVASEVRRFHPLIRTLNMKLD